MALLDYEQLPHLDLSGIFILHFTFSTLGILSYWSPDAYTFYNAVLLAFLFWALKEQSNDLPLILAIRVNVLSIVFDICVLLWCFYEHLTPFSNLISFLGILLHFMLRFITTPLLSKMCSERSGGVTNGLPGFLDPIFGISPSTGRNTYDDIDNMPHQSYPRPDNVIIAGTHSYAPKNNTVPYN